MHDKNALKLPWDRTLKGIFLQLAFVVVLNVFYLNFEKANRELLIKIYNKILKQGNIAAYIDNQRVQKIVFDFKFFTF